MGFGPRARDEEAARQAVRDIVELLYPDRATPSCLDVLDRLAVALWRGGRRISFEAMARFLADPKFRAEVLDGTAEAGRWTSWAGRPIAPESLDADFAALLSDRLTASRDMAEADDAGQLDE
jgi:hypothetical protein